MGARADVWDLLVIGGGTAGLLAARTSARFGARVLLVDRDEPGGDCLWTGCVPSKALLAAGKAAHDARHAGRFGVSTGEVRCDVGEAVAHARRAVETIAPVDSAAALERDGVRVRRGSARFVRPGVASVDGREERYRHACVATGADPVVPRLPGVDDLAPGTLLTTSTMWEPAVWADAPTGEDGRVRLVVLGGGATGCELAQAFARLGLAVTLVEGGDRLLAGEDPDASALLRQVLEREGVQVRTGVEATAVRDGALELADGTRLPFDRLLVAVGRRPATDGLGLDAVGVETGADGAVVVDARLRTGARGVWAAGDVTGAPQYTHVAGVHGSVVAQNAVLGLRRRVDDAGAPRVTFTDPEVASVGVPTGADAGGRWRTVTWPATHIDRAVAEDRTDGWTRLAVDRRGRVVGATVVGPRAGEVLGELSVAVAGRLTTSQLTGVTHAYPTYADGTWNAAIEHYLGLLASAPVRAALGVVVRTRRRWGQPPG